MNTVDICDRSSSPVVLSTLAASMLAPASRLIGRWREYESLRTIESLPEGLQKDIGWPASDRAR